MPDYAKRIQELTDVRARAARECDNQRRLVGQRLVALPAASRPPDIAELLDRHTAAQERVESASSAIERMIQIDDRENEIRGAMKALQKERDHLEQGLEGAYEQIGSVAFRLFKQHPLIDASYSSAFQGLAKYQDAIRKLDSELEQVSVDPGAPQRGAVERLRLRARRAYLANRRSVRENQLPRLLQEAGRSLSEGDFIRQMDDDELNSVATPVLAAHKRRQQIDEELQKLREESGALVAEFNTISSGKRLPSARKERESQIDAARDELNGILFALGSAAEQAPPTELEAELRALRECEERRAHFDSMLERLEAGRAAELMQQDIESLIARKERLEQDVRELKQNITDKRDEHESLLSRRGEETDLFDQ